MIDLVIGLGNPLMGDDGLGLAALAALRERWTFEPEAELVDGGTWGMNLLYMIEDADRVLFLDAIDVGAPPGTLIVLERDRLPRLLGTKLSPHQIDLRDVLALAELRGTLPRDAVAMGFQPARVEMSTELSPMLRRGLPGLLRQVVARLEAWGHLARERVAAAHA
jgi:hydrogenase maturation protease